MAEVKDFVIEKVEPLITGHPSLQIHLSKTYDIPKWFAPGLLKLVTRIKPLDEEDVRLVGLPDSLKVCALREKLRRCEECTLCGAMIPSDNLCLGGIRDIAFDIPHSDLARLARACCACSEMRPRLFDFKFGLPGVPSTTTFNPAVALRDFQNLREREQTMGQARQSARARRAREIALGRAAKAKGDITRRTREV